jgi:hypothetical protein
VKTTASKIARIQSLEPLTSAGRIRFRRDWRTASASYRLFVEQLTMYPVAAHDDGPDALEGAYQLAASGSREPFTVSAAQILSSLPPALRQSRVVEGEFITEDTWV